MDTPAKEADQPFIDGFVGDDGFVGYSHVVGTPDVPSEVTVAAAGTQVEDAQQAAFVKAMEESPRFRKHVERIMARRQRQLDGKSSRVNTSVARLQRIVNRQGLGGVIRGKVLPNGETVYIYAYSVMVQDESGSRWPVATKMTFASAVGARRRLSTGVLDAPRVQPTEVSA